MRYSETAFMASVYFLMCLSVVAQVQDTPDVPASPHFSKDPREPRRISNAKYAGRSVHTKVTQQFEMYDPHSEVALRDLKSMGFTQVILDWPHLHEAATEAGLNVVLANWWTLNTSDEEIAAGIARARDVEPQKLVGFSVMDEPGRNAPDTPLTYYTDLYRILAPVFREQFPATRLEISHWGPMAGWTDQNRENFSNLYRAADVMRIMPYPDLYEAPLDDVFFMMRRSTGLMEMVGAELPLVVILQAWVLPPKNQLPEIEELRVMAYQAMLSGAETLSFFEYNPGIWNNEPGFSTQFRKLMFELTQFSRSFSESDVETKMDENGILTATLTSRCGSRHRIFVNTRRTQNHDMEPLEVRMTGILKHLSPGVVRRDHVSGVTPPGRCGCQWVVQPTPDCSWDGAPPFRRQSNCRDTEPCNRQNRRR